MNQTEPTLVTAMPPSTVDMGSIFAAHAEREARTLALRPGNKDRLGLVAYLCRSKCSFRPLGVRRPRGFFLPKLNVDGAGYRSH